MVSVLPFFYVYIIARARVLVNTFFEKSYKKKWDTIHPTQNLKERRLALLRPSEAVRVPRANCAILGIVPTYLLHGWSSYGLAWVSPTVGSATLRREGQYPVGFGIQSLGFSFPYCDYSIS